MTTARRTRMSPQARRDQLISEGLRMLDDRALDQVSVEEVAEAAGVSRALLFHYFESKQDFLVALTTEQSRRMLERTEPDLNVQDPIAIARGSLTAYIDYVSANRSAYLAILQGTGASDPAMRKVADDTRTVMAERVLGLAALLELHRTPLIELAVHGWVTFSEQVTVRWLQDEAGVSRDEIVELIARSLPLLATLAADPNNQ
ncbi:TetR/AcrR family transcriptional regulator [Williamsia sp. 1135]|uniref:TetR/AcrR family transcriptional regulator n=1 Tax=Williamsia sp. 1135 TaxID=1889262 RepID=UPI000A10A70C|nr:TetR/AcrR family transcriptional regulator [Williamsia sp. 1135]ORM26040.1 TetR family transcriptional regulator [Williamsia sp. 1135]